MEESKNVSGGKEEMTAGYLLGFVYKSLMFLEMGIVPVWVFDGEIPEAK